MATQYIMRAFNTVLNEHIYWYSINSPDLSGTFSGYPTNQLQSIVVDYTIDAPSAIGQGNLSLLTGPTGAAGADGATGARGPQGAPGTSATIATAGASITGNRGVYLTNGNIQQHTGSGSVPIFGFLPSALSTSASGVVTVYGQLDGYGLGDGYACAVGLDATGKPVRAFDPTCVSAPNWLGYCDAQGNIFVQPRRTDELNIIDFGAIQGDSSPTARAANNAAFTAAMKAINIASAPTDTAVVIRVPTGDWYFAGTINITRPVHVIGVKGKFLPGAKFNIPDGYVGIKTWHSAGQAGFPDVNTAGASGTVIEGIYLHSETNFSLTTGSSSAYGFFLGTLTSVNYCVVENFGGHGIYISSENSGFPDNWQVEWTRVTGCQDGIHVIGGDSNNGLCTHGDFQGNRGFGVYGHSFLGDGFIECHTAENALGAYSVYAVGVSSLINCYSEADCPPSEVTGNTFVIGGEMGAGFTGTNTFFGGSAAVAMNPSGFVGHANGSISSTGARVWSAGLTVLDGYTMVPTSNGIPTTGYIYQAQNNGTTGGTVPDFTHTIGDTTNDNGIIWKNVGIEPRVTTSVSIVTEVISYTVEVVDEGYPAGRDAFYPYSSPHAQILQVRYTTDGGTTWIYLFPQRADYGYNYGLSQYELGFSNIHTTVAAGSDGVTLPHSTINVASTAGFSSTGKLLLQSTDGLETITYTGTTGTSFTGCAGGTGTIHTGNDGYQGGSGTTIYFTPYYYYADNSWTGTTGGGITTQFLAGSNEGTYSAYGWGHFLTGSVLTDPRHDAGSPWRVVYNLTNGRWQQLWANSIVSKEWCGSRSLPFPGAEVFDFGLVSGNETFGFNKLGWFDGSQTYGSVAWRGQLTSSENGWFSPGDLILNRNATTNYPVGMRATQHGGWSLSAGYGYNVHWSAGLSMRVGDAIYPSVENGFIFRADIVNGATGNVEPVWPLSFGAQIVDNGVTWTNVGTQDGYGSNTNTFEPFGVASPLKLTKDCTAGGTITLSFDEISHERYFLTGSPGSAFTVVIGTGAGDSWNRVVFNSSGQNATISAGGGDPGTVVLAGKALHLLHTGTSIIVVGS